MMTIRDVAEKANVSITTVSMVLNGKPVRVSEEKKKAVFQAAKALGYQKRHNEKHNACKPIPTFGLIIPDICSPYFSALAKGILMEAKKSDYDLLVYDSDNKSEQDLKNLISLQQKGVEGIILALSGEVSNDLRQLTDRIAQSDRIPIVLIDRDNPLYNSHAVVVNHQNGSMLATEHLLQLGHQRIGFINGSSRLKVSKDRLLGYHAAFERQNLEYEKSWIVEGDYQISSGYELSEKLLKQKVTAIFAGNDMIAFGVYKRLRELGLRIPEDLSLVGFDDVLYADFLDVPLTTVRQPFSEMGKQAVHLLLEYGGRPDAREKTVLVLQPELVIRKSTMPAEGWKPSAIMY